VRVTYRPKTLDIVKDLEKRQREVKVSVYLLAAVALFTTFYWYEYM